MCDYCEFSIYRYKDNGIPPQIEQPDPVIPARPDLEWKYYPMDEGGASGPFNPLWFYRDPEPWQGPGEIPPPPDEWVGP